MDRALTVSRFRIGDCVIDRLQRTVTNPAGTVRPRPKVFDVLVYLVENRERVVSKEELFRALWSGTATTDDALVACIGEIRRLLGDDSRHSRIVLTVPKKGYIFAAPIDASEEAIEAIPPSRQPARRVLWWIFVTLLLAASLGGGLVFYWGRHDVRVVGWWRFDESGSRVLDRSGHANDGIIFNGLRRQSGPHGGALVFDGSGYVNGSGPGNSFPHGDSPFTISAWLSSTHLPPTGASLLQFGTTGWNPPRANMLLRLSPDGRLVFGFGFGYQLISGSHPLTDGLWHHVAGVYHAGKTRRIELFADGEGDGSGVLTDPANVGARSVWTIGIAQGGGFAFQGMLADLRLYRGALTHPQLAAMYRCGLPTPDVLLPGGRPGYYLPLYRATISAQPAPEGFQSAPFVYDGYGHGGVEFAAPDGACTLEGLRGVSVGENLRVGAEVLLPAATQAGPFFHARRVAPGDPIEGKGNGGYWVRLHADGVVSLHSLNHAETEFDPPLAASAPPPGFDRRRFHTIEIDAKGNRLRVLLDHAGIRFPSGETLPIPANGNQEGAAGIGFLVEGQPVESIMARRVVVDASTVSRYPFSSCDSAPLPANCK